MVSETGLSLSKAKNAPIANFKLLFSSELFEVFGVFKPAFLIRLKTPLFSFAQSER